MSAPAESEARSRALVDEAWAALAHYESGIRDGMPTGLGPLQFPAPDPSERAAGRRLAEALRALLASRVSTPPTPTLDVDEVAKVLCRIEGRSTGRSLDEVVAPGVELWMRHRYEAERLIEELSPLLAVPAVPVPPTEPETLAPMSPVFEDSLTDDEWVERRLAAPTEPEEKRDA